jgi:hypothetical protein
MWVRVYINGATRGTRWCSGQAFIDRILAYAMKKNLDVGVEILNPDTFQVFTGELITND